MKIYIPILALFQDLVIYKILIFSDYQNIVAWVRVPLSAPFLKNKLLKINSLNLCTSVYKLSF